MPPELKTNELPSHIQHTIIVYLAKVFLEHMAANQNHLPTKGDLATHGFDDIGYLVNKRWVIPPVGRYAISYAPGDEVKTEMERLMKERRAA